MLNEILRHANKYSDGLKKIQARKEQWLVKHKELKAHLEQLADYLDANTTYKQDFYVDMLHAYNEDMHGTCADMPSVAFRSGDMPMLLTFRNSMGERKSYIEEGFSITFSPTITGQILVLLLPHHNDLNKNPPEYSSLAVINDPGELTMDMADRIISNGMEVAYHTSFTGMSEPSDNNDQAETQSPVQRTPIGFKRYETTQKII
ncbi:MAG: hypothetical protein JWQ38_666 [Flavipsychrobacter sp.]|nr:hypothetical protein [Flavipsychrobacter sp.]